MSDRSPPVRRRRVLQYTGSLLTTVGVAGCGQRSATETESRTTAQTTSRPTDETSTDTPTDSPAATESETPTQTNISEPELTDGVTLEWVFDTGESPEPTVTSDAVLVGDRGGMLRSFDRAGGTVRWSKQLISESGGGVAGTSVPRANTVFTGTTRGTVIALDATTGTVRWSTETPGRLFFSPILHNETVYAVGTSGEVAALDPTDGTLRWTEQQTDTEDTFVWGDPAITASRMFLSIRSRGILIARRLDDWSISWQQKVGSTTGTVTDGNRVFFGTEKGVRAVEPVSGEMVWDYEVAASPKYISLGEDGIICAAFESGAVHLVDVAEGTRVWQSQVDEEVTDIPSVESEQVYVATRDGSVYALNRKDGSQIWRADVYSEPEIDAAGDFVAVGAYNGAVFGLRGE